MNKKNLALTVVVLTSASQIYAKMDASTVIRMGERQIRGLSTQAALEMVIKKPNFTRTLELRSWTDGDQKTLVEILKPAKEERISSLRVHQQMWNYLPKTDQVVRVPTSLMLQSWMGSDFTNDDLMKSSSLIRDYNHKIAKTDKQTILIECIAKPKAPVVWGKILYLARVADNLPLRETFYDEKGALVRTLTFDQFQKMDDRVIPTRVTVNVAGVGNQTTTLIYQKILYDRVIDRSIFDKDSLRRSALNGGQLASGWSTKPLRGHEHVKSNKGQGTAQATTLGYNSRLTNAKPSL